MAKVEKITFKQPPPVSNKDIMGIKKIAAGPVQAETSKSGQAKITNKSGSPTVK